VTNGATTGTWHHVTATVESNASVSTMCLAVDDLTPKITTSTTPMKQ